PPPLGAAPDQQHSVAAVLDVPDLRLTSRGGDAGDAIGAPVGVLLPQLQRAHRGAPTRVRAPWRRASCCRRAKNSATCCISARSRAGMVTWMSPVNVGPQPRLSRSACHWSWVSTGSGRPDLLMAI